MEEKTAMVIGTWTRFGKPATSMKDLDSVSLSLNDKEPPLSVSASSFKAVPELGAELGFTADRLGYPRINGKRTTNRRAQGFKITVAPHVVEAEEEWDDDEDFADENVL